MAYSEDDTCETVSRYIQELLERRADVQASVSSAAPALETELVRRVESEEFRKEMVSRFARLNALAKEAVPPSTEVGKSERRVRLRWISLIVAAMAIPILFGVAWNALNVSPRGLRSAQGAAGRGGTGQINRHGQPFDAGRTKQDETASTAALQARVSPQWDITTGRATRSGAWFWPTVTEEVRRTLHTTATAFVSSGARTVAPKPRARSHIERMLNDALNDRILGSHEGARIARIELLPNPAGPRLSHRYVGDVLDASRQRIGRVSGTYTVRPESLSASVRYEGDDRVEYSTNYFEGKF
jgi:hypothetical protein